MTKLFFFSLLFFFLVELNGQNKSGQTFFDKITQVKPDEGTLEIDQVPEIEELIGIHIDLNKRSGGIDGFRIQLYLGSSNQAKKEASDVKARVLGLFPDDKIYVMYEAPFWRVQMGNFRSKNESLGLYKKLKKQFPNCYPVPVSNIKMTSLD